MTGEEQRGYAKGYAAGKRRAEREGSRDLATWRREQFRQQAAMVALPILTAPGSDWGQITKGEHKRYRNMDEYAQAAFKFADYLAKHTYFSGDTFAPPKTAEE